MLFFLISLLFQVKKELLLLQYGCDELKNSRKFVKILEAVLVVGNYLNGDTSKGDAKGFKLDALLKLVDVKACNKQISLLHFVIAELLKVDGQVLDVLYCFWDFECFLHLHAWVNLENFEVLLYSVFPVQICCLSF